MKHGQPEKTNAARLLDRLGIRYELRGYEVDENDLTAVSVARKIGLPPEQVFKTLLTKTIGREYVFAVVPGDAELDLKKLAQVCRAKKVELASLKDVEPLTGYVRGGVTVMGARRQFPAFVDETVEMFEVISVSAGQRGLQLLMSPVDYLWAAEGKLAELAKLGAARAERGA